MSPPPQPRAALSRFTYDENSSAISAYSCSSRTNRSSAKHNPLLAAHLGLGRDEIKGPLAQLAQVENDEISEKPIRGRKSATNSSKTKSKPRSTKSAKTASKKAEASVEVDVVEEKKIAQNGDIKDWSRTKPGLKSAENKKTSSTEVEQDCDVDHEAIPEVCVSIRNAKRKLDTFLFSDAIPASSEHNTMTGAQEAIQEVAVNLSPRIDSISNDVPSAAYTEDELLGDLWQNNVLAEGDMPDYDDETPVDRGDVLVAKQLSSTQTADVSDDIDTSDYLDTDGFQAVYEAVLDSEELLFEEVEEYNIMRGQVDPGLDHLMLDQFDDELEDDAFRDLVVDELIPNVEREVVHEPDDRNTSLNEKHLNQTTIDDAALSKREECKHTLISDFEFDEDDTWIIEELAFPAHTEASIAPMAPIPPTTSASIVVPQSDNEPRPSPHPPRSSSPIVITSSADDSTIQSPATINPLSPPIISSTPSIPRTPYPKPTRDRSSILGLSASPILRTCFRLGSALKLGSNATRSNQHVILELYARVLSSHRDESAGKQYFTLADLMNPERPPLLEAVYEGWKEGEPWRYDSGLLICEKKGNAAVDGGSVSREKETERLCRCLGRVVREGKGWCFKIMNVWKAEWEDVEWVRGIYG